MNQLLVVKHLAQSEAKEEAWHEIMISALRVALRIKATANARSSRHLIGKAATAQPNVAAVAALEACKGAHVPMHVSDLLQKWASKFKKNPEHGLAADDELRERGLGQRRE